MFNELLECSIQHKSNSSTHDAEQTGMNDGDPLVTLLTRLQKNSMKLFLSYFF